VDHSYRGYFGGGGKDGDLSKPGLNKGICKGGVIIGKNLKTF